MPTPAHINILMPKSIKILCDEVQPTPTYSTPRDIADILAKTFASVSSNDNYIPSFLPRKRLIKQNLPDFGNMNCSCNQKFKMRELECILAKIKNTTPGEDGVTYGMIKNMPVKAKEFLLRVFNRFFRESYFPPIWNRSTVIPIPKPGKNPNSPKSYRPISLTSCLCKLMERLINERFMEFLIMHRILTPAQSGGVRNRSTIDH